MARKRQRERREKKNERYIHVCRVRGRKIDRESERDGENEE